MNLKDKSIRKLLKDGLLTGHQAAQLVLRDSVEQDHKRPRILSDADVAAIRRGLTSPKDIQEYNGWIQTYQVLYHANSSAIGMAGQVTTNIWKTLAFLTPILAVMQLKNIFQDGSRLPKVVTQVQFERLKEEQINKAKDSIFPLWEVLDSLWPPDQGATDIVRLLEGVINGSIPVSRSLNRKEKAFLKALTVWEPEMGWTDREWLELELLKVEVSVKDLRAAGYPMEWLEKMSGYAIIQDPIWLDVNEEGDYCGIVSDVDKFIKESLPSLQVTDLLIKRIPMDQLGAPQWNQNIKEGIEMVLAIKKAAEIASNMIGVDLTEELRTFWDEIEDTLGIYNNQIKTVQALYKIGQDLEPKGYETPYWLGFTLETIEPEKLKPSTKSLKEIRDQVAVGLGHGWWKNIKSVEEEGEDLILVPSGGDDGQEE